MDSPPEDAQTSTERTSNCTTICDVFNMIQELEEEDRPQPGLISQHVFNTLNLLLAQVTIPIIQLFGIATNTINLKVFMSMGLTDVVTFCFFALSLSDLCYLVVAHFVWLCYTLHRLNVRSWVRLDQLSFFSIWYAHWLLAISTLITTYIAVQRCCCVALPLKVKSFFTPKRNVVIIVCLCLLTATFYLPLQSGRGMKVFIDPLTNESYVGVWYADNQDAILEATDYFVLMTFPITVQVITVVCMVILVISLRKSSKFRQASTSTSFSTNDESSGVKNKDIVKAKGKEVQVVKAVTFVTLMFIMSNTLPIITSITRRTVYNFQLYRSYRNLYLLVNMTKDAMQQLNSSLNIIIYFRFNTSYKNKLRSAFRRSTRKTT